jgi:diamine N-acetyltransferase
MFVRSRKNRGVERNAAGEVLARGERTLIRTLARADIDDWLAWPRHRDPLFENYNPPRLTERQRDLYYQQRRNAVDSQQFSVDDVDGTFVGRISIRDIDPRLGASVLGISFHPLRLNDGLGSDALHTFLNYYFGRLEMDALFLDVAAFNLRARRVYEKCGFRECGRRWGPPETDFAGVFRKREYESIRHLFCSEHGLIRPLVLDMVLRRETWKQNSRARR